MEEFRAMCNVHSYRKIYTANIPNDILNFDHVIVIGIFLINPMRENKLPLKTKFMKESYCVLHHLKTHVLLPRKEYRENLVNGVHMWLITLNFQVK